MPFKAPEASKCKLIKKSIIYKRKTFSIGPKCNQSVYAAEEVPAAGKKWHKMCFKCGMLHNTNIIRIDEIICFNQRSLQENVRSYDNG